MLGVMPYVIHAARITHECKIQRMSNLLYRLHHSCSRNEMSHMTNTGNETRTRMVFSPMDFKSIASTIPPCQLDVHSIDVHLLYRSITRNVCEVRYSSQARLTGLEPVYSRIKIYGVNQLHHSPLLFATFYFRR